MDFIEKKNQQLRTCIACHLVAFLPPNNRCLQTQKKIFSVNEETRPLTRSLQKSVLFYFILFMFCLLKKHFHFGFLFMSRIQRNFA